MLSVIRTSGVNGYLFKYVYYYYLLKLIGADNIAYFKGLSCPENMLLLEMTHDIQCAFISPHRMRIYCK